MKAPLGVFLRGTKAESMTDTATEQIADPAEFLGDTWALERWADAARARDRKFWIGLGVAILLHALLLIGIATTPPRAIGDPSGIDNAISIDMITQADLDSRSTVADTAGKGPGAPATAAPPAPQPVPPQPAPQPPEPQAEAKPETPPETPPETQPEAPKEPVTALKEVTEPAPEKTAPDVLAAPAPGEAPAPKAPEVKTPEKAPEKPAEKPAEKQEQKPPPKPQQKPAEKPQQKKTAALDLNAPLPKFTAPATGGGGAAGVERPPGITRSGANDAFARAVIRALQQTMPQLSNTFGRVTVRIVITQNGNLAEVKVLRASNVAGLDQSVMFATKQTSYPFPPPNSIDDDRVFVVTYIYR